MLEESHEYFEEELPVDFYNFDKWCEIELPSFFEIFDFEIFLEQITHGARFSDDIINEFLEKVLKEL